MPMVQMNTRIDADLKAAGDAAFARAGYTPSQAVRRMWEWAARNAHDPHAISQALREAGGEPLETAAERIRKLEALRKSTEAVTSFCTQHNLWSTDAASPLNLPYKELRSLMYEEKALACERSAR